KRCANRLTIRFLLTARQREACGERKLMDVANLTCIYHDEVYLNCTWKRDKEAQSGINTRFYYWLSDPEEHKKTCAVHSVNKSLTCKLRRKIINSNNSLCMYIRASNGFTILSPTCFLLQGHRVLTPEDPNTTDLECTSFKGTLTCKLEQVITSFHYLLFSRSPRQAANWKQCSNYLQSQSLNVGCHVERTEMQGCRATYVYAMDSNNFTLVEPQIITLRDIDSHGSGKEKISVSWNVTKNQQAKRLEFEVQYQSNKDSSWRVGTFTIILQGIDLKKCYLFRVRSKVNSLNAHTSYWSEWTPTLMWKNNTELGISTSLFYLIIIPVAILDFGILICVIYNFKKIKALFLPEIPDPKRVFVNLYEEHNGNFQEWIGSSKEPSYTLQPSYSEVECVIDEVPERREKGQADGEESLGDKPGSVALDVDGETREGAGSAKEAVAEVDVIGAIDMSKLIMNENMYVRL
uniref:Uncharacterized protein n=1 Tax=Callorhinchus milii TaxID=7868 RepID=A0A4W3JLK0_CALMI